MRPPDRPGLLALWLLLLGCGGGEGGSLPRPPLVPPAAPPGEERVVLLEELLAAGADPTRWPELARRLDTPRSFERVPMATGELQIWEYPGLVLTVRREGGAERLHRVQVTDTGYRTSEGLRVGMTREALTGILGQPSRNEGRVEVHADASQPGPILYVSYTEEGTVESLVWEFPTGSGAAGSE